MLAWTPPPGAEADVATRVGPAPRRGGTLILGGGFGGAHVARLLLAATIVSPESSMLYTPLLPEVAAGALEPRHAFVPLREMCPAAELLRGRVTALDETARTVTVATDLGDVDVAYQRLVIALGAVARMLPIPGLAQHAMTFKNLGDAIRLRNHVLRQLDLAEADPAQRDPLPHLRLRRRRLRGGRGAGRGETARPGRPPPLPGAQGVPQRWVLVDAGARILAEVPRQLAGPRTGTVATSRRGDPGRRRPSRRSRRTR